MDDLNDIPVDDFHGLSVKEATFLSLVLSGMPKREALKEAGYTTHAATISAMMAKPKIQAILQRAMADRVRRLLAHGDQVVLEALRTGMARLTDVVDIKKDGSISLRPDMSEEALAGLAEVSYTEHYDAQGNRLRGTTKVKMHPKVSSLKLAAELMGLNPSQRVDVRVRGDLKLGIGVSVEGMNSINRMVGIPEITNVELPTGTDGPDEVEGPSPHGRKVIDIVPNKVTEEPI